MKCAGWKCGYLTGFIIWQVQGVLPSYQTEGFIDTVLTGSGSSKVGARRVEVSWVGGSAFSVQRRDLRPERPGKKAVAQNRTRSRPSECTLA
ncbi:hypothetical protein ANO11243_085910 [Dothideomycetidae sp. 11243]|nr:hypothetical protein ANO11243_085910 [fungal sp. No.11243]